jgi:hypothetical protein
MVWFASGSRQTELARYRMRQEKLRQAEIRRQHRHHVDEIKLSPDELQKASNGPEEDDKTALQLFQLLVAERDLNNGARGPSPCAPAEGFATLQPPPAGLDEDTIEAHRHAIPQHGTADGVPPARPGRPAPLTASCVSMPSYVGQSCGSSGISKPASILKSVLREDRCAGSPTRSPHFADNTMPGLTADC